MRKEQALSLLELIADLYSVANAPEPSPLTFDLDPDAAVEDEDDEEL